jgi:hypothetical protein
MTTIWTDGREQYQLRKSQTGAWHWFVRTVGGGWQQLYGTYPPTSIVEQFARSCHGELMRYRRGVA